MPSACPRPPPLAAGWDSKGDGDLIIDSENEERLYELNYMFQQILPNNNTIRYLTEYCNVEL
jgi:hypothetical protein